MLNGKIFKELRIKAGKTQEEIATHLCISPSVVSKWENLSRRLSEKYLFGLADCLGINVEDVKQILEEKLSLDDLPENFFDPEKRLMQTSFTGTDAAIAQFRARVAHSDLKLEEKIILMALPDFIDYESGVIIATPQDFEKYSIFSVKGIEEHWESVLNSPFVVPFSNSQLKNYAFKLDLGV